MDAAIPIRRLRRVYHVGSLDAREHGRAHAGGGYEGRNLSVSPCPNAWSDIARIGTECHALTREGGVFLDVEAARASPLASAIGAWASTMGLAAERRVWTCWRFDEDGECWASSTHATRAGALAEAADGTDADGGGTSLTWRGGPDGKPRVEPATALVAGAMLEWTTGIAHGACEDAFDAAATAWAMLRLPEITGWGVDGVWHDEAHRPEILSAPRGGIFPHRVAGWRRRRIEISRVDDDREVAASRAGCEA